MIDELKSLFLEVVFLIRVLSAAKSVNYELYLAVVAIPCQTTHRDSKLRFIVTN